MQFTNEYISNEDRQRYDFSKIKRPPIYREPVDPHSWTINNERDVFLVWTLGGNEDQPTAAFLALWWKGLVVDLKLDQRSSGRIDEHVTTTWTLETCKLPPSLSEKKPEVISALKDALAVHKINGIGVPVASHEAKFTF